MSRRIIMAKENRITVKSDFNNGKFDNMPAIIHTPCVGDKKLSAVCETEDVALLVGLAHKYDGPNSRFAQMACRMLKIDSNWAK